MTLFCYLQDESCWVGSAGLSLTPDLPLRKFPPTDPACSLPISLYLLIPCLELSPMSPSHSKTLYSGPQPMVMVLSSLHSDALQVTLRHFTLTISHPVCPAKMLTAKNNCHVAKEMSFSVPCLLSTKIIEVHILILCLLSDLLKP